MKVGITAGDPAGIGLEIVLRSIPAFLHQAEWVLFGRKPDFELNLERFAPELPFSSLHASSSPGTRGLAFCSTGGGQPALWGQGTRETGRRALEALEEAGARAVAGELDAIVTSPLSKELIGKTFSGQTEFFRMQAQLSRVAMAFFTDSFKVALATTHTSLREAIDSLSVSSYCGLIELVDSELQAYGYPPPRIAVAAVNPHAGERGMFGTEEQDILRPAVMECASRGIRVSGPFPSDSLYPRAHSGEFDVVLAPYHDQGLIPVKLIAPRAAANVTLGLPYVRTSPDHGTAFEIAGKGVADIGGMVTAMKWALDLAGRKRKPNPV